MFTVLLLLRANHIIVGTTNILCATYAASMTPTKTSPAVNLHVIMVKVYLIVR